MTCVLALSVTLLASSTVYAGGMPVSYQVNGQPYEGYFVSPSPGAPLILLVHDWDGLTDYEVKRADMLADLGYAVFAADLFARRRQADGGKGQTPSHRRIVQGP